MRCLMFADPIGTGTVDAYNHWARGKELARDVIIHSHIVKRHGDFPSMLVILVFFDEEIHPDWVGRV